MSALSTLDARVLDLVQTGFPVCERPFAELAGKLEINEDELLVCVRKLKESGIIRRFGAIFDSRKLGYVSTLVGVKIPDQDDLPAVAAAVNAYPEVTHNYQRLNEYNLWFTLIAAGQERIEQIIATVGAMPQVDEIRNLPALKLFKIKADFKAVTGQGGKGR